MVSSGTKPVFFLHPPDEVRLPYESALEAVGKRIFWFTDLQNLLEAGPRSSPQVVIIDLDLLKKPFEEPIEKIRASFTMSDLIGLSSSDSAQLALLCLRSGFTDFLQKPTSPEELGWALKKCQQRHDLLKKLDDPGTSMIRALTQISSCTTPTLVRLCTLEYTQTLLGAGGAAWIQMSNDPEKNPKVLCQLPNHETPGKVLKRLPEKKLWERGIPPLIVKRKDSNTRKLFIPSQNINQGVFFWGLKGIPSTKKVASVRTLLEHSELSLLNIQKFDEIKQQTFVDDLTGLYNSRYLKFALTNAIQRCKAPADHFSVLFIDVDHFKSVNDGKGHVVGSEFLIAIGRTVRNSVRNIDPVFRYGGDEFVVILHGTTTEGAMEIAERIRKHVERRVFVIKEYRMQTTVSIGVATYPDHAADAEGLLRLADEAMYNAKKSTRNAVSLATGIEPEKLKKAVNS